MAAGFMAGVTEALVIVTPFEVVKIRLQQQRGLTKELLKYRVRLRVCHVTRPLKAQDGAAMQFCAQLNFLLPNIAAPLHVFVHMPPTTSAFLVDVQ